MNYFILALAILFAVMNNVLLHLMGDKETGTNIYAFNVVCSLMWLIILLLINGSGPKINGGTLFFGALYGSSFAFLLFFKALALSHGPASITSLLGNCSLLVQTLYFIIFWKEKASVFQYIGLLLLILAMFLCTTYNSKMAMTRKWKLYCFGMFAFAAAGGISLKYFGKYSDKALSNDMMIVASVVMILLLSIFSFANHKFNLKESFVLSKTALLFGILCGASGCTYCRLNVYLANTLPSIVFFPVFNGGVIFIVLIFSRILFKEKLTGKQMTGFMTGVAAIMMIGLLTPTLLSTLK